MDADNLPVIDSLPAENVFGHRKKLQFLREQISAFAREHIGRTIHLLDVGCSNGQNVTIHLADLDVRITAIDPHEPSIQFATAHNPCPEKIVYMLGTIDDVPVEELFDIVVAADVLEHLKDPGALMESINSRLREGGIVLVSIPNGYGPFEIENALDRKGCLAPSYALFRMLSAVKGLLTGRKDRLSMAETRVPYNDECGHVQFWSLASFSRLLKSHGLRIACRRNGSWLGALCTSTWFGRSQNWCRWNAIMGDYLPAWCVSVWYFRIEKK